MNKKGIDTTLSLFAATIVLFLLIAFFSIFGVILLSTKGGVKVEISTTIQSLNINMISFLQKSEINNTPNWKIIASGSSSSLSVSSSQSTSANENIKSQAGNVLRDSLTGDYSKLKGILGNYFGGSNERIYSVVLNRDESYKDIFKNSYSQYGYVNSVLVDKSLGNYNFLCDPSVSRISEVYIPQINALPKKVLTCVSK